VIKYEALVQTNASRVAMKPDQVMKEVPSFIKWIQEFFHQLRTKGKEGGRVFTKVFLMYNYKICDITEMLREEFGELKLFLKAQPVQHHNTTTIG